MAAVYLPFRLLAAALLAAPVGAALAQGPVLTAVVPAANAATVNPSSPVQTTFSQALAAGSDAALHVFSSRRGGLRTYTTPAVLSGNTLTYSPPPARPFLPGETVFSTVTRAATGNGGPLTQARVMQFTAAVSGTGRGDFRAPASGGTLYVGAAPVGVSLGDVDGDGDLDMLVANSNSSTIGVYFNNGRGTFSLNQNVAVDEIPFAAILGDLDGDGDLDLASPNVDASTVSIRLNNGAGIFRAPTTSAEFTVGAQPEHLALGDFDGDGDLDLVATSHRRTTLTVLINNGHASFAPHALNPNPAVGQVPQCLALGDVDGDGDLDITVSNQISNTVSVRLNNGTGNFTAPARNPDPAVGAYPQSLALGDVDGDGDLDMLTGNYDVANSTVSLRLNDGTGNFTAPTQGHTIAVSAGASAVTLGDIDADGDLDLLTGSYTGGTVCLRLNDGTGHFVAASMAGPTVGSGPSGLVLGDIDADGDLDLLSANFLNSTVSVRLNQSVALATQGTQPLATNVAIYPNPAAGGTTVQVVGSAGHPIQLLDVLGRTVATAAADATGTAQLTLPVGLTTGVYQVRSGRQVQRLLVE